MLPYIYEYKLNSRDVDFSSFFRVDRIFALNQEIAGEHSEQLGLGVEVMAARNIGWALTRSKLIMHSYPKINDTVKFVTWPGEMRHGFFPRFIELYLNEKLIGTSSNLYVQIDLNTRKIAKPFYPEVFKYGFNIKPLPYPPSIQNIDADIKTFTEYTKYSDFDINSHVNNTSYIRWFLDLFTIDFHKLNLAKEVLIHYNSEITANQTITMELQNKDNISIIKGFTDKPCFTIQANWSKKEPNI